MKKYFYTVLLFFLLISCSYGQQAAIFANRTTGVLSTHTNFFEGNSNYVFGALQHLLQSREFIQFVVSNLTVQGSANFSNGLNFYGSGTGELAMYQTNGTTSFTLKVYESLVSNIVMRLPTNVVSGIVWFTNDGSSTNIYMMITPMGTPGQVVAYTNGVIAFVNPPAGGTSGTNFPHVWVTNSSYFGGTSVFNGSVTVSNSGIATPGIIKFKDTNATPRFFAIQVTNNQASNTIWTMPDRPLNGLLWTVISSPSNVTVYTLAPGNDNDVLAYDTGTGLPFWTTASADGAGVTTVNGLTNNIQHLVPTNDTGGTDFEIVSPLGGSNHLFKLPTASTTARGLLSASDWAAFSGKQVSNTVLNFLRSWGITNLTGTEALVASNSPTINNLNTIGSNTFSGNLGIGTNKPQSKLHVVGDITLEGALNSSGTGSNYLKGLTTEGLTNVSGFSLPPIVRTYAQFFAANLSSNVFQIVDVTGSMRLITTNRTAGGQATLLLTNNSGSTLYITNDSSWKIFPTNSFTLTLPDKRYAIVSLYCSGTGEVDIWAGVNDGSSSGLAQPASANLTNWATVQTNKVLFTNALASLQSTNGILNFLISWGITNLTGTEALVGSNSPTINNLTTVGSNIFSGNLGIGTNKPQSKLHVVGDTTLDGSLSVGGTGTNYIKDLTTEGLTNIGGFALFGDSTVPSPTNGTSIANKEYVDRLVSTRGAHFYIYGSQTNNVPGLDPTNYTYKSHITVSGGAAVTNNIVISGSDVYFAAFISSNTYYNVVGGPADIELFCFESTAGSGSFHAEFYLWDGTNLVEIGSSPNQTIPTTIDRRQFTVNVVSTNCPVPVYYVVRLKSASMSGTPTFQLITEGDYDSHIALSLDTGLGIYQSASANLTNWATVETNKILFTNALNSLTIKDLTLVGALNSPLIVRTYAQFFPVNLSSNVFQIVNVTGSMGLVTTNRTVGGQATLLLTNNSGATVYITNHSSWKIFPTNSWILTLPDKRYSVLSFYCSGTTEGDIWAAVNDGSSSTSSSQPANVNLTNLANVSIVTTNGSLTISNITATNITVVSSGSAEVGRIILKGTNGQRISLVTDAGATNLVVTNTTTNARLGINTNSPQATLHVVGDTILKGPVAISNPLTNTPVWLDSNGKLTNRPLQSVIYFHPDATASNVLVDFSKPYQRLNVTNDIVRFIGSTNLPSVDGDVKSVRIKIYTTNTFTLYYTNAWNVLSTNLVFPSNKISIISFEADGLYETNVVMGWAIGK